MQTTVLKASAELAMVISKDLLSRRSIRDKPIFKRIELENGFEIRGKIKGEAVVIFRFTDDNGRLRFDYDEHVLSFDV